MASRNRCRKGLKGRKRRKGRSAPIAGVPFRFPSGSSKKHSDLSAIADRAVAGGPSVISIVRDLLKSYAKPEPLCSSKKLSVLTDPVDIVRFFLNGCRKGPLVPIAKFPYLNPASHSIGEASGSKKNNGWAPCAGLFLAPKNIGGRLRGFARPPPKKESNKTTTTA